GARRVLERPRTEVDARAHDVLLAGRRQPERRGVAVRLRVLGEVLETAVAVPRSMRGGRVDAVEIAEDGVDRGVEAVEIEAPESDAIVRQSLSVVVAEPADEVDDVGVAPQ